MIKRIKTKLIGNCVLVKGIKRSAIYHLFNCKIFLIPNELYFLFKEEFYIDEISKKYLKLFKHLERHDLFYHCYGLNNFNNFKIINPKYSSASGFYSAYIQFPSINRLQKIIEKLDNENCKYYKILIENYYEIELLTDIMMLFNDSLANSIELSIVYDKNYHVKKYEKLMDNFARLHIIHMYKSPVNKIDKFELNGNIQFINQMTYEFQEDDYIGASNSFNVNYYLYAESLKYNNYFNRKIFIDMGGNIKRTFSETISFGNIFNINLKNIYTNQSFKKYWNIKKDDVAMCKDCEFRYACVDHRIPIKVKNKTWYFKDKCNYSPYTFIFKK